jgi:hypothetical protein
MPVVFKFICVVYGILEIVFCIVDVWFDINKLDVVKSRERRVVPEPVSVDVDNSWVEVLALKTLCKPDE